MVELGFGSVPEPGLNEAVVVTRKANVVSKVFIGVSFG
jgi:hypothetical protein